MAFYFDSWLVELGVAIATLIAGIYIYSQHIFQYWKKKGVLYDEPSFPFGNIGDIAMQRVTVGVGLQAIYDRYEGHKFVGTYQLLKPALMIRDPEVIKNVLVKDFAYFHARGVYHDEKREPLSANLFTMDGTKWRNLRYKLAPTFTSGKMKMMFPTFAECGNELKAHLFEAAKSNDTIEVKEVLAKYTTDVIASCAFGIQCNSLQNPNAEFRNMGRKIFTATVVNSLRDLFSIFAPKLAAIARLPTLPQDVSNFFQRVVRETIEYRESNNVSRKDFMQLMIELKNNTFGVDQEADADVESVENIRQIGAPRGSLTMDEVAAQAFLFFAAGFETSSTTMGFCLYELAVNQNIQERLRDEINNVTSEHGGQLTYDGIYKMEYLDRVIAETLRKYPPLPSLARNCTKDYQLPDTESTIEPGTVVIIPVLAIHHDPKYYPEPEKFEPDRFTTEEKNRRPHYVYLPFGEGGRNCIGERFGLLQAKVGLASLISSYQFNVCQKTTTIPLVIDPKSFIMTAQGGINLKIVARNRE